MELRICPRMIKKLWNVLKITFVMIRKGLASKRKFIMCANMIVKRRNLIRRTLRNLIHHESRDDVLAYGLREYEFSCSNSPNPVFYRAPPKRRISVIPCMNLPRVIEGIDEEEEEEEVDDRGYDDKAAVVLKTPDYFDEKLSPLLTYSSSPFSVRICDYSSEDDGEDEGEDEGGNKGKVDDAAEEFIRRFREQLRMQNRIQLLQY